MCACVWRKEVFYRIIVNCTATQVTVDVAVAQVIVKGLTGHSKTETLLRWINSPTLINLG